MSEALTPKTTFPDTLRILAAVIRTEDPVYDLQQDCGGHFVEKDCTGAVIAACALGKAGINLLGIDEVLELVDNAGYALVKVDDGSYYDELTDAIFVKLGIPRSIEIFDPINQESHLLYDVIFDLNDKEKWTFEQIADWLDQEAKRLELEAQEMEKHS